MMKYANLIARWLALAGGVLLCVMTLMVVVSVSMRALGAIGLKPVPGDFELVEMGTAIAVFFFLPWCYLRNGHAMVDLLYMHLPVPVQRTVTVLSDVLMLAAWVILTWRLGIAVVDKFGENETTFILAIPLWIAHAIGFAGAVIGCGVYLAKTLAVIGLVADADAGEGASPAGGHA